MVSTPCGATQDELGTSPGRLKYLLIQMRIVLLGLPVPVSLVVFRGLFGREYPVHLIDCSDQGLPRTERRRGSFPLQRRSFRGFRHELEWRVSLLLLPGEFDLLSCKSYVLQLYGLQCGLPLRPPSIRPFNCPR